MTRHRSTLILLSIFPLACSATPEPEAPTDEAPVAAPAAANNSGPAITAEVGALDPNAVNEVFHAARSDINGCLQQANEGMVYPVVGGDIEVVIRVKNDGSVRWSFPARSTLGHADTERCILDALNKQSWPRPQGGEEGIARTSYGIDPPGRPAVDWSPNDMGKSAGELTSRLQSCRSQSGASGLSVTVYVDPDGKVMAAGAAADDDSGIEALECAVDAATAVNFPSPGSYPAKVTLSVN